MIDLMIIFEKGRVHRGAQSESGSVLTDERCNLDISKKTRHLEPYTWKRLVELQSRLCWRCWAHERVSLDKWD